MRSNGLAGSSPPGARRKAWGWSRNAGQQKTEGDMAGFPVHHGTKGGQGEGEQHHQGGTLMTTQNASIVSAAAMVLIGVAAYSYVQKVKS